MQAASEREEESLLRLFASYSPAEVVLRYADAAEPRAPEAPEQQDFDAAIGFVDVSGFTALSEKRTGSRLAAPCGIAWMMPFPERTLGPTPMA